MRGNAKKEGAMNVGEGDALWRTGLSYIAWKEPLMKEGILECYRPFGENYHFKRKCIMHPDIPEDMGKMMFQEIKPLCLWRH